MSYSLI